MPNTGKPSLDCHLCRQRRVKCDLGRPSCCRCIKYGVECPGYRDLRELVFKNVDAVTMEKKRKKHHPQQQETEQQQALLLSHKEPTAPPLGRSLSEHWTAHSLPILLHIFDLDFIESIHRDSGARSDGPLAWAAHVFARTCFINVRNPTAVCGTARGETQTELAVYHGKALGLVGRALMTPRGVRRDDVFVTVWILASYELLVGSLGGRSAEHFNSWHLHTRGLCSMLRSRGPEHLYTANGRATFWPAYTMIQAECLITATPCPPEAESWLQIIEESLHPAEGFALAISHFIKTVTATQCRVLDILRRRDRDAAAGEFTALWEGMLEAQRRLQEYVDGGKGEGFQHDSYLYLVNLQRSACVKGFHIMQLLINYLTHYQTHHSLPLHDLLSHRTTCLTQIHLSSLEILLSAPQALGRQDNKSLKVVFEGLKIIWPLISILTMSSSLPEHRLAARESLTYIGKELGVRQALGVRGAMNLYEGEEGDPLPWEVHEPGVDLLL